MFIHDLKVIFICPAHNEKYIERKNHVENLLKQNGFKNIIHYKSSSENYPSCLLNANIDILKTYMDEPILILEDDIEFTGIDSFVFDKSADAIYFGLSKSGGHRTENADCGISKFKNYSTDQVRLLNMLTTHSILYISPQYKKAVIKTLEEHTKDKYYIDVLISRLHPHFKVLANKIPSFYQAARFNVDPHSEHWTKVMINDDGSFSSLD